MKTLAAAKFKAQCLALIDNIAQNHDSIIITKHGKPLVKVIPFDENKDINNKPLKGAATYIGDIISPIDEEWEAAK
jgi:prevent-host-death family protein